MFKNIKVTKTLFRSARTSCTTSVPGPVLKFWLDCTCVDLSSTCALDLILSILHESAMLITLQFYSQYICLGALNPVANTLQCLVW